MVPIGKHMPLSEQPRGQAVCWQDSPMNPGKQVHWPVLRSHRPAAEHSTISSVLCALLAPRRLLPAHATPLEQERKEQSTAPCHPGKHEQVPFDRHRPWPQQLPLHT